MDRLLLEQVQSGDFDPIKEFAGNRDKFLEVRTAMESISNNLPKDVCIKFVLTKIVPTIFAKSVDSTVRDGALEIGLHFLKFVNVSILGPAEQEEVFTAIEESYAKITGELRDSNYHYWDKLWIFLIKLCSERLHSRMSVSNKLLRVVEVAFRNSTSIEQRLKAYDCWFELIDNTSLNMAHMCSAKQIKLLMTPMKAKFSRTPIVISKRCDTFVYLLEKLQDKATLCLREFLEFCFGPFDEKNDGEKLKQGRSVSEVCTKSTTVLLEILGHSHDKNLEHCLIDENIKLYKPLVKDVNFPNFSEILISSVVQCCYLLHEWSRELQKNDTIIKCLWRSVLQFVQNSTEDVKMQCLVQINNSLRKLLEKSQSNKNLYPVLGHMIDLLIQNDFAETLKDVTFDVAINLVHHIDGSSSLNLDGIRAFLVSCFDPENGSKFDKIAFNLFKTSVKCQNPTLCEVWLKCKISLVPENMSVFIWPVHHLKHFEDIVALKLKWTKLYTSECKTDSVKGLMMQEIEKRFLENPLLSSNIVEFLTVITSAEAIPTRDFVTKFMRLVQLILTLPNLPSSDVKKISSIVLTYCNQSQLFYKSENNDDAVEKLCSCLEHLVTIHKDYTVLSEVFRHLKNSQPKNLAKFAKRLMTCLEALMLNEDDSITNNARKLIELLESKENEPEGVSLNNSRAMRLINMANTSSKGRKSTNQLNNSKFASPLSLKTTTTAVASPRGTNKKKKDQIIMSPDNSADYVKMDTIVKINVENLNEHQKEMFKKRREDIPALYQDLTQSQSQDFFNSIGENQEVRDEENEKKRKNTDDDEGNVSKVPKIFEEPIPEVQNNGECKDITEMDTETQIVATLDSDLTDIFTDGVEPVQREPPEELFEETPPKILERPKETESVDVEENKENQTLTENDQMPVDEAPVEEDKAESNSMEKDDVIVEPVKEKTSPRRKSSSRPSTPSRKSSRNTTKVIKELVAKQLDDVATAETDRDKVEENEKIEENGGIEVATEGLNETSARKRGRRSIDKRMNFLGGLAKGKSEELVLSRQDERKRKGRARKQQIQVLDEPGDTDEEYLSIEDLLAKVDRRIEENKRLSQQMEIKKKHDESTLQDGNQNRIICPADRETENAEKKRIFKKAKRQLPVEMNKTDQDEVVQIQNDEQSVDVYEFKGDEGASVQADEVKKPKRKPIKKTLGFTRSSYITKRRKKVRRDRPSLPSFHVTADSPIPLSKSPSLRTVQQSNETITIVITRSPLEDGQQISEASSAPSSPKRKTRATGSPNSEDVIESSQTPVNASTVKRTRNRRSWRQTTLDEAGRSFRRVTRNSKGRLAESPNSNREGISRPLRVAGRRRLSLNEPPSRLEAAPRLQRSKSLDKLDFTRVVTFTKEPEVVGRNDATADTLTCDTEVQGGQQKGVCDADTLTLSPVESQTKDDVPTSPVTCETPDRIKEFLNDTSDISPINSAPEVRTTPVGKATSEVSNVRVARLLQMVNSNVQVSSEGRRWFGNKYSSPGGSRVKKMSMRKEENLDILTFSREVPSPLTVPASGILKRKFHAEETATPSPKRKRVNFSDPAITAKKIFIKDAEEYEDKNEKPDSTNESHPQDQAEDVNGDADDKKSKELFSAFDKEVTFFNFKDFCDSNFKDINDSEVKTAIKCLLRDLKGSEVVEVLGEFFGNIDAETSDEIKTALERESPQQIVDGLIVPAVENLHNFEKFRPTLLKLLKKLPDEKLQSFMSEVTTTEVQEKSIGEGTVPTESDIQDQVINLDCDKMNDLIKKYVSNLKNERRNDFLIDLMKMASDELPVNKQFVNQHVDILQNFVKKMD